MANSKSNGPSNAISMASSISSGSSPAYGGGAYGAGYYPESIVKFKEFLSLVESIDSNLIDTINNGIDILFLREG